MKNINDSGTQKRYSKIVSVNDVEIQKIIAISTKHTFASNYKKDEYAVYKIFAQDILKSTNNYKEEAIIFDKNGNLLLKKQGTSNSVKFIKSELEMMKGNKLIHNHPSGSTLSDQDVKMALHFGLKEIVAFSGKGYYYRLIVKDSKNIDNIMLKYEEAKKEVQTSLFKILKENKITKEDIKKEYLHFVLSVFASNTKEVAYEKTKH